MRRTLSDRSGELNRESRVRWRASEWLNIAGPLDFPSVLLQPLGHLSVSVESAVLQASG